MIVRISTEGQYRLPDAAKARLDELDEAAHTAAGADDADRFAASLAELLDYVRRSGERLADDDLSGSDLILPPADTSLVEARADFTGEGLIPD